MAVISVKPRELKPATASRKFEGTEYSVVYIVETDDSLDGPQIVTHSPLLPAINSTYQFGNDLDGNSFLTEITPKLLEHTKKWEVTCKYEPSKLPGTPPPGNPLELFPTVEVNSEQFQQPVEEATFLFLNGAVDPTNFLGPINNPVARAGEVMKIQSSSGEPFDPPIEMDVANHIVRITRNEFKFKDAYWSYLNAINSDLFTIRSGGLNLRVFYWNARLRSLSGSQKIAVVDKVALVGNPILLDPGTEIRGSQVRFTYWSISFEIAIHRHSWDAKVLDRGFRQRLSPGDAYVKGIGTVAAADIFPQNLAVPPTIETTDMRGAAPANPQLLDGHGKLLGTIPGDGNKKVAILPTPVFSNWRIYDEMQFRLLNL